MYDPEVRHGVYYLFLLHCLENRSVQFFRFVHHRLQIVIILGGTKKVLKRQGKGDGAQVWANGIITCTQSPLPVRSNSL